MKRTDRQGEVWTNNDGENLHIIEYNGVNDCTIRFGDGTILKNIQYHNIISGCVKNSNRKSVFDVGYIVYGTHKASVNGKHTKCYSIWRGNKTNIVGTLCETRSPFAFMQGVVH